MKKGSYFISVENALYFHEEEIKRSGGAGDILDLSSLEAAIDAPKATFEGVYLYNIFEMATTYVESIVMRHPFLDGNKRTGAVCAVTFLYMNGYELIESYDEDLADRVLDLIVHKISKSELSGYFRNNSKIINDDNV